MERGCPIREVRNTRRKTSASSATRDRRKEPFSNQFTTRSCRCASLSEHIPLLKNFAHGDDTFSGSDCMAGFITEIAPRPFFKHSIIRVCQEEHINSMEKFLQIDYLSKMLSEYVDTERFLGDSGDLVRLIDVLKREVESNHNTLGSYQKTADRILFYHSFFPETFRKRLVNVKFYAKAARIFYRLVSSYHAPVCGYLSQEYSLWNCVLRTVKARYMF